MNLSSRSIAEDASFSAFINCYLREIDTGKWVASRQSAAVEARPDRLLWWVDIVLQEVQISLRLQVSYRSLVGRHTVQCAFTRALEAQDSSENTSWVMAEKTHVLIAVIQNIYKQKKRAALTTQALEKLKIQEVELLVRLFDSHQLMARYLDSRKHDSSLKDTNFLSSEQSSLYGHWLHPTPKSRQGMTSWQQSHYSPELQGRFKLHYFSVDKSLVIQGSVLAKSAAEIIYDEVCGQAEIDLTDNHVLIPQHPLQAHYLLLNKEVRSLIAKGKLHYLGELGAKYTPTSSVRTLFTESSPWMYKFSIPVKITNSLRSNMKVELEDGMEVEKYLRKVGFLSARPQFKIVDDPAYISVNLPSNPEKESGFEVVVRRNLVYGKDNNNICSILALVQDPVSIENNELHQSLLKQQIVSLALKEGRSEESVANDWFARYFECAIESLILLYDTHGIALEAHLQNSLLDISNGYPSVYYYRDNQGFYLSRQHAKTLRVIDDSRTMSEVFYEDSKIFEAFSYYVFFNQLFAVINRLGVDGLVSESGLVFQVRTRLSKLKQQLNGIGRSFIDYILEQELIAYKTNLLARVNDVDELHKGVETTIYTQIANPLMPSAYDKLEPDADVRSPLVDAKEPCHAM